MNFEDANNPRPISTISGKIFVNNLRPLITKFIKENKPFNHRQFGLRTGMNTVEAISTFVNDIATSGFAPSYCT